MRARGLTLDQIAGPRPTCYACNRPTTHCVCGLIQPFEAHCRVVILQHPNERKKYYSTAKLVHRGISNSTLLRGMVFDERDLERALGDRQPYLLFPGPDAVDCETVPLDSSHTIILIDGTWSEAGKIVRRNPLLAAMPRISFQRPLRSRYRIRKQPKEHCLSTLESVAHFLQLNAQAFGGRSSSPPYHELFTAVERMVEQQLAYFPRMKRPQPVEDSIVRM